MPQILLFLLQRNLVVISREKQIFRSFCLFLQRFDDIFVVCKKKHFKESVPSKLTDFRHQTRKLCQNLSIAATIGQPDYVSVMT